MPEERMHFSKNRQKRGELKAAEKALFQYFLFLSLLSTTIQGFLNLSIFLFSLVFAPVAENVISFANASTIAEKWTKRKQKRIPSPFFSAMQQIREWPIEISGSARKRGERKQSTIENIYETKVDTGYR